MRSGLLSVDDLAAGAAGLELGDDGVPRDPLGLVDLSRAASAATAAAAADALRGSARVVVGVCPGELPEELYDVAAACSCVLTRQEQGPWSVAVEDLDATASLQAAAARAPRATAVLGPLLRLTSVLSVPDGLVAESLAYSMLLAGPEFAAWRADHPVRTAVAEPGEAVLVRREDDVLEVALNRPTRHNAYSRAVRDALVEALTVASCDAALRVVLTGNGPSFCSGGDLDEFGSTRDVTVAHQVRLERSAGRLLHELRDRVTVLLHGACIGAGAELPAFAGRVLAAPGTRLRLPELAMGLLPGAGGTVSVTARIGRWRTAWMVLSGSDVDVPTALRWGLVDGTA